MSIPKWLKEFADNELSKSNPFTDISSILQQKNNLQSVEAMVEELRKRVGLDKIEKQAEIRHVERAKERGEGTIKKWCVYPKNGGNALGCHSTRQEALNQLRAIEANKQSVNDYYIEDVLSGGLGDNQPDKKYDPDQLEKGIRVELEHTNNPELAKEIAKDHLEESKDFRDGNGGKYYDKLEDIEENIKDELVKANKLQKLIVFANNLEKEGFDTDKVDFEIRKLSYEVMNDANFPRIFNENPKLQIFIDNACRTSGGLASVPAIQDRIRKEVNKEIDVKNEDLEKYIQKCLEQYRVPINNDDSQFGAYITVIVDEDDGNTKVFDE